VKPKERWIYSFVPVRSAVNPLKTKRRLLYLKTPARTAQ